MISRETFVQFLRFAIVGGGAAISHYCIALFGVKWAGFDIQLANLLGFWFGFILSYFGQANFTFGALPSVKSFFLYLLLGLVNYIVSVGIVYFPSIWLPAYIVFAITIALIPLISFLVSKFFIFSF